MNEAGISAMTRKVDLYTDPHKGQRLMLSITSKAAATLNFDYQSTLNELEDDPDRVTSI